MEMVVVCWTGCGPAGLGLAGGEVVFGRVALGVVESRVWRRARVWAWVRVGGVLLGLVGGTAMMEKDADEVSSSTVRGGKELGVRRGSCYGTLLCLFNIDCW